MKIIKLPFRTRKAILACGADMKGAFAFARGDEAYLFDGFGDLSELDNFTRYEKAIGMAEDELKISPKLVVCDLHPGYFSTQFAEKYNPYKVQHHQAHVASAIADNGIRGAILAVAFDGTGYGTDGKIWGGEFFTGDAKRFKRSAHFKYLPMPGGEACIRQPWRMAASYIYSASRGKKKYNTKDWPALKQMIEGNINSPLTSSVGRLFDAVGSIILNKKNAAFEAELPMALEKIIDEGEEGYYGFDLEKSDGSFLIDVSRTIKNILKDLEDMVDRPRVSARFHNTVARIILDVADKAGHKKVVLTGGVFQNKFLVKKARKLLIDAGYEVYMHSNVETNDSGIPLGQIAIANERILCA